MTIGEIIGLIFIWNIIGFICILYPAAKWQTEGFEVLNPKIIYYNVKVNWFGCFWLTLLFNLLCPIITICYWFYKLCTIGRKD